MKHRLFLKFLLLLLVTSFSVVALMIITMQFFVYRNFSDYVVQQELDSLDGLAQALSTEYQKTSSWENFVKSPRFWHETVSRYFPADGPRPLPHPEADSFEPPPDYQDRMKYNKDRKPLPDRPPKRGFPGPGGDRVVGEIRELPPRPQPPRRPPELSGMARRLSLFDSQKQVVIGNPVLAEQVLRPVEIENQVIGWLGLKKAPQMMRPTDISFLKRQSRAFYMTGAIVLMMAVVFSILFSRQLTTPVRKIAEGTRAIRNRRFDLRIPVTSNDELGQLADDFNAMAQALQSHEIIRRQWLTDIAHELRTPLAVLRGEIEALQDGVRQVDSRSINSLHGEVMAMSKIVDDLSLIARTESGLIEMKREPVNPVQVLEAVIQRFDMRFRERRIDIRRETGDIGHPAVKGDADKLARVFGNIFENTLRYASSPGTLVISSRLIDGRVRVSIEDSGPGVPDESLGRLFDRLYRTDSARNRENGGAGLGLSICKSIVEAHQGNIWAEKGGSGGLRLVMELPLDRKQA